VGKSLSTRATFLRPPRSRTSAISQPYYLQVVGHRENIGDAIGADRDPVLGGFAVGHTLQGNASILHDDTDGLLHAEGAAAPGTLDTGLLPAYSL
jgi:hypothetical protein